MTVAEIEAKIAELDRQETELQAGLEQAQAQEAAQVDRLGAALAAGDTQAVNEFQRVVSSFQLAANALVIRLSALKTQRPVLEQELQAAKFEAVKQRLEAAEAAAEPLWRQFAEQLDAVIATGDELLKISQGIGYGLDGNGQAKRKLAQYYSSVPQGLLLDFPLKKLQSELRAWHVLKPQRV